MRPVFAMIALLAAMGAYAQNATLQNSMEAQINRQIHQQPPSGNVLSMQAVKPNEIRSGSLSYNGIFVQLHKTDNPLQLINPAASATYGSSEDNTVWDPITGEGRGLKLFSISF